MFFQCNSCGARGRDDQLQTGMPDDIYDAENDGDNVPGGGDFDYFESKAECCPQCNCTVSHYDAEEFADLVVQD